MTDKKFILTKDGLKKLEEELEKLKVVRRKEVAERLKEAIALGDLSENSEYDDAKNEQAFIEGRIQELEVKLRNVEVISDEKKSRTTVRVLRRRPGYGDERRHGVHAGRFGGGRSGGGQDLQ